MKFTCPYCKSKSVPPPVGDERYQTCGNCGKRPRVCKASTGDKLLIKYVATSRKRTDDPKKVRTFRASDLEMKLLEQGKLRLVISNNRVTIAV